MSEVPRPKVAIVDYGLGNLFSVKHACEHAGLEGNITSSHLDVLSADAVILPGVGAFGDAMASLRQLGLVNVLRDVGTSQKALVGICLGMQLFMSESYEFGCHRGLGIIEGDVVQFKDPTNGATRLKVPHVGWNRICQTGNGPWSDSFLDGLSDGDFMYFVHSFYVRPADSRLVLTTTSYGDINFCSTLNRGNLFACQFHPERSGAQGLRIYRNLARQIRRLITEAQRV